MQWHEMVEIVKHYIIKIETPSGHGTGFFCFVNHTHYGIATANHVVSHANKWLQPLNIIHPKSGESVMIQRDDKSVYIFGDGLTDSALLLFPKGMLSNLPHEPLDFLGQDKYVKVGSKVGWLGFPALFPDIPCFFSGSISAFNDKLNYLVDGVSIHGVSGGPVFFLSDNRIKVIGIINSYYANRTADGSLPGLVGIRDVRHFISLINEIKNVDEALKQHNVAQRSEIPSMPDQYEK